MTKIPNGKFNRKDGFSAVFSASCLWLESDSLKPIFADVPLEFSVEARNIQTFIELPTTDGTIERFRILESPVLAPQVAADFSERCFIQ